jgi:hypothetical protein
MQHETGLVIAVVGLPSPIQRLSYKVRSYAVEEHYAKKAE